MHELNDQHCEACRPDSLTLTELEIAELLQQIPAWQIVEIDAINRLVRRFRFKNFIEALAFTNKVGEIAESEGHHPAILTEWGSVEVSWWSHKIKGLHSNDFIMAAKTDSLYS
jgi:4a-hydroxytetrahydrobiopterin dehydratase